MVGQHVQQDRQLGHALAVSSRVTWPTSARSSRTVLLGPLDVAAEPEEVVGDAAGQIGVAARERLDGAPAASS